MTREVKVTLGEAILPTLPAILGVGYFLTGVMADKLLPISQAPAVDLFRKPTYVELITMYAAVTLYGLVILGQLSDPFCSRLRATRLSPSRVNKACALETRSGRGHSSSSASLPRRFFGDG
jgi:hypothetical protein